MLFSNILNLFSSFKEREKFYTHTEQQEKLHSYVF
jgi:hypothetical protein